MASQSQTIYEIDLPNLFLYCLLDKEIFTAVTCRVLTNENTAFQSERK